MSCKANIRVISKHNASERLHIIFEPLAVMENKHYQNE